LIALLLHVLQISCCLLLQVLLFANVGKLEAFSRRELLLVNFFSVRKQIFIETGLIVRQRGCPDFGKPIYWLHFLTQDRLAATLSLYLDDVRLETVIAEDWLWSE
jgi:hypothetical protein